MPKAKPVTDYLNKEYASVTAMLKAYHISKYTFYDRQKKGLSLKDCLTLQTDAITDHKGNTFHSITEMCNYWNISKSTYDYRIANNWTQEKALTTPSRISKKPVTDHLNNSYKNTQAMCDHYGIDVATYNGRINAGWSMEAALTEERKRRTIIDPYTKQPLNTEQAAKKYNIKSISLIHRLNNGYSILEALNIIPLLNRNIKNWKLNDHITIVKEINVNGHNTNDPKQFFLCIKDNHEVILTRKYIIQYCEENLDFIHTDKR